MGTRVHWNYLTYIIFLLTFLTFRNLSFDLTHVVLICFYRVKMRRV